MSNTVLAWLAILLFVIPFALVVLAERMPDGPDWLDSEGFEMFMSLIAFVALMGLFPLVAANSHLVENGSTPSVQLGAGADRQRSRAGHRRRNSRWAHRRGPCAMWFYS